MKEELERALKSDDVAALAKLIGRGLELDGEGRPPLVSATLSNAQKCMALLLEEGADPNGVGTHYDAPLMMVQDAKAVKLLVDAGAEVDRPNPLTKTPPLVHAAAVGSAAVIKALLKAGADPNTCKPESSYELSALDVAVQKARGAGIAKALMTKPPSNDLIARALSFGLGRPKQAKTIDAILGAKPPLDGAIGMSKGKTWRILHVAVERGDAALTQKLIDHGADPDQRGSDDLTPVFMAASHALSRATKREHFAAIAQVLVDAGADLDVVCTEHPLHAGKTAKELLAEL